MDRTSTGGNESVNLTAFVAAQRFFESPDGIKSDRLLEDLLQRHAMPIVQKTIHRKTNNDAERGSAVSDASLRLVRALSKMKAAYRQNTKPAYQLIKDWTAFVTLCANQGFGEMMNENRPEHRRLRKRIHYLLRRADGFEVATLCDGRVVCLARPRKDAVHCGISPRLRLLIDDPEAAARKALECRVSPRYAAIESLVCSLLTWIGQPVDLSIITGAVGRIQGLVSNTVSLYAPLDGHDDSAVSRIDYCSDPAPPLEETFQQRAKIRTIWENTKRLTLANRRALLLFADDCKGESVLQLLRSLRIADDRELAESVGVTATELASLWHQLPLTDCRIASITRATTQSVRVQRNRARQILRRCPDENT